METNAGRSELIFILVLMALIVLFGLVAVGIFVRVWRREREKKQVEDARD